MLDLVQNMFIKECISQSDATEDQQQSNIFPLPWFDSISFQQSMY